MSDPDYEHHPDYKHFYLARVFLKPGAAEAKEGEPLFDELFWMTPAQKAQWAKQGGGFVFAIEQKQKTDGSIAQDFLRIYGLAKSESGPLALVSANANSGPEWDEIKITPPQFKALRDYYDATVACNLRSLSEKERVAAQLVQAGSRKKAEEVFGQLLASSPLRPSPLKEFLRQSVSPLMNGRKSESDSLTSRQLGMLR